MTRWLLVLALLTAPIVSVAHELEHHLDGQPGEQPCELCGIAGQLSGGALPAASLTIAVAATRVAVTILPKPGFQSAPSRHEARGPPAPLF